MPMICMTMDPYIQNIFSINWQDNQVLEYSPCCQSWSPTYWNALCLMEQGEELADSRIYKQVSYGECLVVKRKKCFKP